MRRRPEDFGFNLLANTGMEPKLKVPTTWKLGGIVAGLLGLVFAVCVIWLLVLAIQWLSGKV